MTVLGCIGLLCALQAATAPVPEAFDRILIIGQVPYHPGRHNPVRGKFAFEDPFPERGRILAVTPKGPAVTLTPEFASAGDPSLSFDAKRILFSGKRPQDKHWNIWEMDPDGKNKRQLTADFGNCREPRYLAMSAITPPEFEDKIRWITFISDAAGTLDEQTGSPSTALYAQSLEPVQGRGIVTRRSTFNILSDFSPTVLSDGRILFTSRQPAARDKYPHGRYPLLTTNWDGTGTNLFYGGEGGPLLKTMACESPDRTLLFVESDGETADGSGQLARISFRRPLHSREVLSKGSGFYRSPHPLPDGRLLVAFTPGNESLSVYLFDLATGTPGRKVHADPKWDDEEVLALVSRPEPQGLLSAVVDSDSVADLQCLNVYDSDRPEASQIRKGDVKHVRFVEGVPISRTGQDGKVGKEAGPVAQVHLRILGEAPVEEDGSFYVRLPADTPFYIQTLDRAGMALQTLRSWIWVRRGTSRGCIGCHENKELAPENRATMALRKIQPAVLLAPPEERPAGADFQITLIPLLQRRCASCHGENSPAGGLNLAPRTARQANSVYEELLTGHGKGSANEGTYVIPGRARTSPLINMLFGNRGTGSTNGHQHPPVDLSKDEEKSLIEWIDLGARREN